MDLAACWGCGGGGRVERLCGALIHSSTHHFGVDLALVVRVLFLLWREVGWVAKLCNLVSQLVGAGLRERGGKKGSVVWR